MRSPHCSFFTGCPSADSGGRPVRKEITLSDVMSRIQQAQTVLLVWQLTLTTDDGKRQTWLSQC